MKALVAGLIAAALLSTGAFAGSDLNEVGALLVCPVISVWPPSGGDDSVNEKTFVTITNAGPEYVVAHVSWIDGESESDQYCYECDFEIPLAGNDTETLVITRGSNASHILAEDLYLDLSCPWNNGMLVVALEDDVQDEQAPVLDFFRVSRVRYLAIKSLEFGPPESPSPLFRHHGTVRQGR